MEEYCSRGRHYNIQYIDVYMVLSVVKKLNNSTWVNTSLNMFLSLLEENLYWMMFVAWTVYK